MKKIDFNWYWSMSDPLHSSIPSGKGDRRYTNPIPNDDDLVDEGRSHYTHILPATSRCYGVLGEDNDGTFFFHFLDEDEIFHDLYLGKAADC